MDHYKLSFNVQFRYLTNCTAKNKWNWYWLFPISGIMNYEAAVETRWNNPNTAIIKHYAGNRDISWTNMHAQIKFDSFLKR